MSRPSRKKATPAESKEAKTQSAPEEAPQDDAAPAEATPEGLAALAPKVDPKEGDPPLPKSMATLPQDDRLDPTKDSFLPNLENVPNLIHESTVPKAEGPAHPPVSQALKDLAPKTDDGGGTRRADPKDVRKSAINLELSKALQVGTGPAAPEHGEWRILADQVVARNGQPFQIRAGTLVSTQSHDIRHLQRAGVGMRALNERAKYLDAHGWS